MRGLPTIHALWAICVLAFSFCLSLNSSAAQSTAPPAKTAPSNSATASAKQPNAKAASLARANLRKLAAEHKVITTDDLEKPQTGTKYHLKMASESTSSDAAQCDAECATKAREVAGFGPDRLGEWDVQLIAAKHSLASNPEWRRVYFEDRKSVV